MPKAPRLEIGTRVRDKFKIARIGDDVTMGTTTSRVADKMVRVRWDKGEGFRSGRSTFVAIMLLEVIDGK